MGFPVLVRHYMYCWDILYCENSPCFSGDAIPWRNFLASTSKSEWESGHRFYVIGNWAVDSSNKYVTAVSEFKPHTFCVTWHNAISSYMIPLILHLDLPYQICIEGVYNVLDLWVHYTGYITLIKSWYPKGMIRQLVVNIVVFLHKLCNFRASFIQAQDLLSR